MSSLGSGNSHNTGGGSGGGARNLFGSFSSSSNNNSSTNDSNHHSQRTQKGTTKDKDSDNEATATPIHAAFSSPTASIPPSDLRRSSLQRSRSERRRRRTATSSSAASSHFASFTSAAAATSSSSSRHPAWDVSSGARDDPDRRGSGRRSSLQRHRHFHNHVGTSLRFRQVDLDWTPDDDDDDYDGRPVVDREGEVEVEVEVVSSRTFSGPGRATRDFHGGLLGGTGGGGDGAAPDARHDKDNNPTNTNNSNSNDANDDDANNDDDTAGDSTSMDIEVMDLRPAAHPSAMMMAVTSSFVSMSSRVSIESDDLNGLFRVAIATDDHRHDAGDGHDNRDPLEERPEHWVTASEIVDDDNGPSVVPEGPSAMMMIAASGGPTTSASSSVPREERPSQTSIRRGSRTRRRLFGNVPPLFSNLSSTLSSLRHQQRRPHPPDDLSLAHRTHSSLNSMDGSGSGIWTGASHSLRSSNSTIDSHPSVPSFHGRGAAIAGTTTDDEDEDGSNTSSWAVVDLLGRRKWYVARMVKVALGVVALAALMGSVLYLVLEDEEDAGGGDGGGGGWAGPSLFSRSSSPKNALLGDWFVSVEEKGMGSGGGGGVVGGGGGNGARAMMNGDVLMLPHDEGYERDARHEDLRLARRRERERRRKEERTKGRREERIAWQQRGVVHP